MSARFLKLNKKFNKKIFSLKLIIIFSEKILNEKYEVRITAR